MGRDKKMNKLIKLVVSILIVGVISGCSFKNMMLEERVSPYGMQETIEKIQSNAKKVDWVSPGVKNMNKAITKHGGKALVGEVRIIELCNAQHASKILSDEDARYSALFMPCSIGVYTKSDGKTYVSNVKANVVGDMMGGTVAEVMQDVNADQMKMLEFLD